MKLCVRWAFKNRSIANLVPVCCILHIVEFLGIRTDFFTQVVGDEILVEEHDDQNDSQYQHNALKHVPSVL